MIRTEPIWILYNLKQPFWKYNIVGDCGSNAGHRLLVFILIYSSLKLSPNPLANKLFWLKVYSVSCAKHLSRAYRELSTGMHSNHDAVFIRRARFCKQFCKSALKG